MRFLRIYLRPLLFSLAVLLLVAHASSWHEIPLLKKLEWLTYDTRMKWLASDELDERIVIIDVDEKSLREKVAGGEGRWPWPRNLLAALFRRLIDDFQVDTVAVDFIFSETDNSSGLLQLEALGRHELKDNRPFLQTLEQIRPSLEYDRLLSDQLGRSKVVLGTAFHNQVSDQPNAPKGGIHPSHWQFSHIPAHSYPGVAAPLEAFQQNATALGHLNPIRDADGVTRRVPMLVEYKGLYYPSLSLAVASTLANASIEVTRSAYASQEDQIEALVTGGMRIPVDSDLTARIAFRQLNKGFTYIPAADVLHASTEEVPALRERLKGRIVLLGTSAAGLADHVTPPFGATMPGVEVHANMISSILDDNVPMQPRYVQGMDLVTVVVLGLLMTWASYRLRPGYLIGVTAALLALITALNLWAWMSLQLVLPLATPLSCVLILYVLQMSYGYLVESRSSRQVAQMFASYVPPALVQVIARNPDAYNMEATEKNLTVMFVNIRDFSSISQRLSPSELAEWINTYLSVVSHIICEVHKGTLDKYMGDAVMAFWGAPVEDAQHAEHAVDAAMMIRQAAQQLNFQFRQRGWPAMTLSIGINSGLMRVGDMGSDIRKAYTVMGDAVNIAGQIQTITREYGVEVLMGNSTATALQLWQCRSVDCVKFAGRRQSIELFEPIATKSQLSDHAHEELKLWQQALLCYRQAQWTQALEVLHRLIRLNPTCFLYALYKRRIQAFMTQPELLRWDKSFHIPARKVQNYLNLD